MHEVSDGQQVELVHLEFVNEERSKVRGYSNMNEVGKSLSETNRLAISSTCSTYHAEVLRVQVDGEGHQRVSRRRSLCCDGGGGGGGGCVGGGDGK